MVRIIKKIECIALAAVVIGAFAGCSKENAGSDGGKYGSIKTITTPSDFKGNTGDVKIESGDTYAVIKIKGYEGEMKCKLFPEAAPEGVDNFVKLANSGYYSDKIFHRVMKDFMIQGGSANGDGMSTDSDPEFNVEYNSSMRHYYGALCYANAGSINGSQFYIVNNKSYSPVSSKNYENNIAVFDQYISQIEKLLKTATGEEKDNLEFNLKYYSSMKSSASSSIRALDELTEEMEEKYKSVGGVPRLDGGYTVFGQMVEGFEILDAVSKVEVEKQIGSDEESRPVQDIVIESVTIHTA